MKKILFSAYSLDIGGIETALVALLNELAKKDYKITLVLERKQGMFLNELNKNIDIIEYRPNNNKNIFIRKILNLIKRLKFILKYKNKFDFSASYATYSLVGSFVARTASKNNVLWCHADYLALFNNDKIKVEDFFNSLHINKFKKIVFVSKEGRTTFLNVFPQYTNKTIYCNNLIDYNKIINKADEKIDYKNNKEKTIFVNIGRHDEKQKKLSRIIEASAKLKKENYKFDVIFVGEGIDTKLYIQQVKEYGLKENIAFLGKKSNPYPYMKMADCIILSSDYEGYPVVFLESMVLNKPIITTKVSDYEQIEDKFGLVTEKSSQGIYDKMKYYIENGFQIKEMFDYKKYNKNIMNKIEQIIGE